MSDARIACPVEGCEYAGTYRLGRSESSTFEGWMYAEHPEHPEESGVPRNVKPKELHTEMMLAQDGELNF